MGRGAARRGSADQTGEAVMLKEFIRELLKRFETKPSELTLKQRLIALHINASTP